MDKAKRNRIKYIQAKLAENPDYKFANKIEPSLIEEAKNCESLLNRARGRPRLTDEERAQHVKESAKKYYEKTKLEREAKPKGRPRIYTDEEIKQRTK